MNWFQELEKKKEQEEKLLETMLQHSGTEIIKELGEEAR